MNWLGSAPKEIRSENPTLRVKAKDKEINLSADSKSTKAALEKLKVGDTVRVYYTEKDGKIIAASAVKAEEKKPETK